MLRSVFKGGKMKPNKIHLKKAKIMCEYLGDICDNVKDKMIELISQGLAEAEAKGKQEVIEFIIKRSYRRRRNDKAEIKRECEKIRNLIYEKLDLIRAMEYARGFNNGYTAGATKVKK